VEYGVAVRTAILATCLVAAVVWVGALVLAPSAVHQPGRAAALAALPYLAGRTVCHQQPARSFHVRGTPMPVCARCAGLYGGGLLGLAVGLAWRPFAGRDPDRGRRILVGALAIVALPTAATVGAEWVGLAAPDNLLRATLAAPLGATVALLVAAAVRGDVA
jgi:uncharacterized membrane protein